MSDVTAPLRPVTLAEVRAAAGRIAGTVLRTPLVASHAVSRVAGAPHAGRLLALPPFLRAGGEAGWGEIVDALRLTGFFLERDLLGDRRRAGVLAARDRLVERVARLA